MSVLATWYCLAGRSRCHHSYPDGPNAFYAAVSRDLGYLRGRVIHVTYMGRSVDVRAIDCLCSRSGGIDLYADAFRVLAPLSRGKIEVTISW